MNPSQKLLAESIATKQRPGIVLIMAPMVNEHGTHAHDGISIDILGGMPVDQLIGQLELTKQNIISNYTAQQEADAGKL